MQLRDSNVMIIMRNSYTFLFVRIWKTLPTRIGLKIFSVLRTDFALALYKTTTRTDYLYNTNLMLLAAIWNPILPLVNNLYFVLSSFAVRLTHIVLLRCTPFFCRIHSKELTFPKFHTVSIGLEILVSVLMKLQVLFNVILHRLIGFVGVSI